MDNGKNVFFLYLKVKRGYIKINKIVKEFEMK